MIVRENISFERGQDPKSTMGLGIGGIIDKEMKEYVFTHRKTLGSLFSTGDQGRLEWAVRENNNEWVDWVLKNGKDFTLNPPNWKVMELRPDVVRLSAEFANYPMLKKLLDYGFRTDERALSDIVTSYVSSSAIGKRKPYQKILKALLDTHEFPMEYMEYLLNNFLYRVGDRRSQIAKILRQHLDKRSLKESINFNRGESPKETIGLGIDRLFKKIKERIAEEEGPEFYYHPVSQEIYKGIPIVLFMESFRKTGKATDARPYICISYIHDNFYESGFFPTPEESIDKEKKKIDHLMENPDSDFYTHLSKSRMNESVNFERGLDPKRAMGLGSVKVKGDRGYGDYKVRLIKPYKGSDLADGEEAWEIEYLDSELAGATGCAFKYPSSHVLTRRGYWGEIDSFLGEVNDSLDFERGMNPKQSMGVGVLGRKGLSISNGYVSKGSKIAASIGDIVYELTNYYKKKGSDRAIFRFPANTEPPEFLVTARPGEEMDWPEQGYRKISYEEIVTELILLAQNDPEFISWFKSSAMNYKWDNWQPLLEEVNFERGKSPKQVLEIGLRYKKNLQKGDIFLVWNKNKKDWKRMEATKPSGEEFYTTYETPDLFVNAKEEGSPLPFRISCIWNPNKNRWEFLNQLKLKESLDFERGKNPKSAMGIGMKDRALEISGLYTQNDERIPRENTRTILQNLDYKVTHDYLVHWYPKDGIIGKYSIRHLLSNNSRYDYLLWEDEYYPIPGKNNSFFKSTNESIDFERGKDPREVLGLGIEQQIENFLKSVDQSTSNIDHKLKICARYGKVAFVEYLIKQGANPRAQGDIALIMAVNRNDADMVETLLKAGSQWGSRYISSHRIKKISPEIKNLLDKYKNELDESLDFERGKNAMDTLKLGIRSSLQSRKMGFSIEPSRMTSAIFRIWNDISKALEVESPEDVFFLGRSDSSSITRFPAIPKDILENISPYIFTDEAIKKSVIFDMGTGNKYQVYQTPWGKILKEMVWGNTENYYVNYETAKELGLYKYPILNESVNFERGMDPKRAIGIGIIHKIKNHIKKLYLKGESDFEKNWESVEGLEYRGYYILVLEKKYALGDTEIYYPYTAVYVPKSGDPNAEKYYETNFFDNIEGAIEMAKKIINKFNLGESVHFERGIEPYRVLNVGVDRLISRGESIDVLYKGNIRKCTAIDDEELDERTGKRFIDFVDPDGDMSWAVRNEKGEWIIPSANESIEFERGQDPKRALDIGMNIFDADGLGIYTKNTGFSFDEQYAKDILKNMGTEVHGARKYGDILVNQLNPDGSVRSYSINYLIRGPGEHSYVRYAGELYPIPNPNNRLSSIKESVSFERREEPKDSLGIGNPDVRMINKIDRIAMSLGFQKVSDISQYINSKDYEDPCIAVWTRKNPKFIPRKPKMRGIEFFTQISKTRGMFSRNQQVALFKEIREDYDNRYYVGAKTGRRIMFFDVDDFLEKQRWENIFEGLEFERGKDPKKAIGIGGIDITAEIKKMYTPNDNDSVSVETYEKIKKFLSSFLDKPLEGTFKKGFFDEIGEYKFVPFKFITFFGGSRVIFEDKVKMSYEVIPGERYFIKLDEKMNESIDFERGMDPKRAMKIGLPKEFPDVLTAADWAAEHIELITNGEYNIRTMDIDFSGDFLDSINTWLGTVDIAGVGDIKTNLLSYASFLRALRELLIFRRKGLIESVKFQRSTDLKSTIGIGMNKNVREMIEKLLMKDMGDINEGKSLILYLVVSKSGKYVQIIIDALDEDESESGEKYLKELIKEVGLDVVIDMDIPVKFFQDADVCNIFFKTKPIMETLDLKGKEYMVNEIKGKLSFSENPIGPYRQSLIEDE